MEELFHLKVGFLLTKWYQNVKFILFILGQKLSRVTEKLQLLGWAELAVGGVIWVLLGLWHCFSGPRVQDH